MKLTIDNLDGLGAVDYSAALLYSGPDRSTPFELERTLNAPSLVRGWLCLAETTLLQPTRRARVTISSHTGLLLFTGYLATEPVAVYAGVASRGSVYRLNFTAISDEWLLDKQAWGSQTGIALAGTNSELLKALVSRLDAGALLTSGLTGTALFGVFVPSAAATWSAQAGSAAANTYAAYRALNGTLSLMPAGSVVHTLSEGDGSLNVSALQTSAVRELANDVTVSGEREPTCYWTELFRGDGTTTEFDLGGQPDAPDAGKLTCVADSFNQATFNAQTWAISDPGSHLSLTANGLTMTGGNGIDGQTTLTAYNLVELGGTILVELDGVALSGGSAGVLGGLYSGATTQANCVAGFNVRQSGGSTLVTPMVNGLEAGTSVTVLSGHFYTLRIRLQCPEILRARQTFYAMVGGVIEAFGGGLVNAPLALVFELRDNGSTSNTPVTVLYDGAMSTSPAKCSFVAVNSVQLFGSVAAVAVSRTGSAWVRSTDPGSGATSTRLIGKAADGVDCSLTSSVTGKVTFLAGRVPVPGELVTVSYRGTGRAVGRVADAASIAAEAAGGSIGTARWIGHVEQPVARSSEDCENAAQAILSFATNRAAAVKGSYVSVNPATGDIWPGDTLALTANGSSSSAIVRSVLIEEHGASPEVLTYRIAFANDWAEGLGLKLSEAIATDALLPQIAQNLAPGTPWPVLANLSQMTVAASTSALTIDAGTAPPSGGGFEVRRRDGGFGVGATGSSSGDLVLRSPVRGFSIPRAGTVEKFYVRMYDASTPPLYSRESSAIVTNLPLS